MAAVLIRALGLIMIIALGYFFKVRKIAKREDGFLLSKIIMNVTLPCSILVSAKSLDFSVVMIVPFLLGILCNLATDCLGLLMTRQKDKLACGVAVIQNSGYNIGTFALPFIQSFFPPAYIMTVLLFDTGNSIMVLQGNFLLAKRAAGKASPLNLRRILSLIFSSIPLCVYLLTLTLSLLKLTLPHPVISIASIAGNANPFLAMLMIGILVDLNIDLSHAKQLVSLLTQRLALNGLIALVIFFFFPLDTIAKQMLVICLMAPISILSPVYCLELGSRDAQAANLNSLSILASIAMITLLMLVFA